MELINITNNLILNNKTSTEINHHLKPIKYNIISYNDIDNDDENEYDTYKQEIENYKENLVLDWNTFSILSPTTTNTSTTQTNIIYSITSDIDNNTTTTTNNNLFCKIVKSSNDTRILNDTRLFINLNNLQIHSSIFNKTCYFDTIQNDIKPYMRKIVVGWMLEVCEEEKCDKLVYPLAVYILDKFLSIYKITRNIFQLVACICLFLSSKIFNVMPISAYKLALYSDNSISINNIIDMEIIILNELKWDLLFVTPIEYIDFLMNKLNIKLRNFKQYFNIDENKLINHCRTLIYLCLIESECLSTLTSVIASSCLISAFHGLYPNNDIRIVYELIANEANLNIDEILKYCSYVDTLYANSINKIE